jgi:pepF/M3 family oligoendopeptidase
MISGYLDRRNAAGDLIETLETYLYGFIGTDSYNQPAARLMSLLDPQKVRLEKVETRFQGWLGALAGKDGILEDVIAIDETAASHAFSLEESVKRSRFLMSDAEESLAAELSLSGANAWTKLHGVVISQLKAQMDIDGEVKELPLSLLTTYTSDPDENLRERAFKAMEQALASAREPLAACLNGVKGTVNTVNDHRGRQDALDDSLDKARIDRRVLETMLEAMESAFPMMHRYRKTKAKLLGKQRLEQWDLPAPVGDVDRRYEWDEARAFILTHFATYSPRLKDLASKAFNQEWIDAEPRDGKQVGGFCMRLPTVDESRILLSYDGRLGRLTTLAHELGHAYHNECLRGKTSLQALLPMTLAETASIFCENIVTDAILDQAGDADEELAVLDSFLLTASFLTLEIYSRFLFESEIFERRKKAELSADDFCELTSQVYRKILGDTIVDGIYRPYDWAIIPHYYSAELSFYNYPYTFGFLFSLGLYQLYRQGQPGFHQAYDRLLAESGMASAVDLGQRLGIDIRKPEFWAGSYEIVRKRVERFEELVEERSISAHSA